MLMLEMLKLEKQVGNFVLMQLLRSSLLVHQFCQLHCWASRYLVIYWL